MNVADIGEFGLIERLTRLVEEASVMPQADGFRLRVGIGDDAAVWQPGHGTEICTTDTMVQGIHFTLETTPWSDVGWKVMATNLSDVAAMGGIPIYALVTLGLPQAMPVPDVDHLYDGILEACREYNVAIVGGDVVASPMAFVTVVLTGVCRHEPLTRSSARQGDAVAIAGPVGASAAGLEIMRHDLTIPELVRSHLVEAHRRPTPRVDDGQILARLGILCAMDISDGLVGDLEKLCLASGVAAQLESAAVPVSPSLRAAFPTNYLDFAMNGGEDYSLIFVGPRQTVTAALKELHPDSALVGRIVDGEPGRVTVVGAHGHEIPSPPMSWDHFKSS